MDSIIKVFKFGGASVKDAEAVRNIPNILSHYPDEALVIILSAMGKTTNHLESLVDAYYHSSDEKVNILKDISTYHSNITRELFKDSKHPVHAEVYLLLRKLESTIIAGREKAFDSKPSFDFIYDQIVPYGELLSTTIVSYYLNEHGCRNQWYDVRQLIRTDDSYREGRVDWDFTQARINELVRPVIDNGTHLLTQGFIANNQDGKSVTLGREGSDYTASIFAYALDAAEVVFWKDVPGLMNADPKDFSDARKLDQISYWEAIELSYYGAKVIHPKTIKPLQNKTIPLKVKSFINPGGDGSLIFHETSGDARIPSYIIKDDQVLISFSPKDLSFIAEENLHYIIGIFIKFKVSINLMQTSAITFSVCVDNGDNISKIIKELQERYNIKFNESLVLITIRHYTTEAIQEMVKDKTILLEQRSRSTVQYVTSLFIKMFFLLIPQLL